MKPLDKSGPDGLSLSGDEKNLIPALAADAKEDSASIALETRLELEIDKIIAGIQTGIVFSTRNHRSLFIELGFRSVSPAWG